MQLCIFHRGKGSVFQLHMIPFKLFDSLTHWDPVMP